jgi:hypothetical protein
VLDAVFVEIQAFYVSPFFSLIINLNCHLIWAVGIFDAVLAFTMVSLAPLLFGETRLLLESCWLVVVNSIIQ